MAFGAVLDEGGSFVFDEAARVTGDPFTFAKNLDGCRSGSHLHHFASVLVGDAVEVLLIFNVVVDVDGGLLEQSIFVWC